MCEHPLLSCFAQQVLTMSLSPFLVRGVDVRQAPAPCSCLTIYPHPITSWRGLGHAQAGKPERDPLQFTRDRRLAAQHSLDLLCRREQLVGLARGEMLARLGLDMVDECRQVAARLRRIVVRQIGLHRL